MGSVGDKLTCHVARWLMSIMPVSMRGGLMMGLLQCTTKRHRGVSTPNLGGNHDEEERGKVAYLGVSE